MRGMADGLMDHTTFQGAQLRHPEMFSDPVENVPQVYASLIRKQISVD